MILNDYPGIWSPPSHVPERTGIAMIWLLVVFMGSVGILGLSIDMAYSWHVAQQLQRTADAASLAGASFVRTNPTESRDAAVRVALANKAGGTSIVLVSNSQVPASGDVILGSFDRATQTFQPASSGANAVKVIARRTGASANGAVGLFFGPLFGVATVDVERVAIAMVGGGTGAGLITLNKTNPATFRLNGTPNLVVQDVSDPNHPASGDIQINSTNTAALSFSGTPTVQGSEINVSAPSAYVPAHSIFAGTVNVNQPSLADPLAGLPAPPLGPTKSASGGPQTLSAGYYPQGLSISKDTTLQSGIYVLGGSGLSVKGNAALTAIGVMIYLLPNSGGVDLGGTGAIDIQPLAMDNPASGAYGGIAIWQAAGNNNPANLRGTGQFNGINGTLYFPTATVDIVGTSDNFSIRQLVADSISLSGSGTMHIVYDGRFPAPGTRAFLVDRGGAP